jgi:hypothetical protein
VPHRARRRVADERADEDESGYETGTPSADADGFGDGLEDPGTQRRVPGFSIGVQQGVLAAFPGGQASRRRSCQAARAVSTIA